ncbi:MAG: RDD family protein, partial [Hydrogenophaga sp.]|nr:RDD family protein [Hydrogenophaga sp.]
MACWLYEGMLMFGVVFIAGYLFSTLTQTRHALDNRHMQQAFLFVVFGIYFT